MWRCSMCARITNRSCSSGVVIARLNVSKLTLQISDMRSCVLARARKKLKDVGLAALLAGSKRSPMPASPAMMLCTLVGKAFDDPQWIFEPKLDVLRVLCHVRKRSVRLVSRNGKSQNFQFPEIVEGL